MAQRNNGGGSNGYSTNASNNARNNGTQHMRGRNRGGAGKKKQRRD